MNQDSDSIFTGQIEDSTPSSDTWMMTFADLLSLLLVFFIMIYAMSSIKDSEWEKILESLEGYFKSVKMVEEGAYSTYLGVSKIDIRNGIDLDYLNAILENRVNEDSFLSSRISINNDLESLVVTVNNINLFTDNTPVLNEDARVLLFVLGEALQRVNNKIEVVTYTKRKGRRAKMGEWELTLSRAVAVAAALREYGNLSKLGASVDIRKLRPGDDGRTNSVDIIIHRYTKEY